MPAYRSSAENDVRQEVVAMLRKLRPSARIIHEINIDDRRCRADVLAVTKSEIYAVEIKSEKDKLDRLKDQLKSMRNVAHHVIAAVHEKHITEINGGNNPSLWTHDTWWVYPNKIRNVAETNWIPACKWRAPSQKINTTLPPNAISILWRDELAQLCEHFKILANSNAPMKDLIRLLRWHCNGEELTTGICAMLRQRNCCEADAPIFPNPTLRDE